MLKAFAKWMEFIVAGILTRSVKGPCALASSGIARALKDSQIIGGRKLAESQDHCGKSPMQNFERANGMTIP